MEELNGVGDDLEAVIVVKGWADAEAIMSVEVPRFAAECLVVDDDGTADGTKGGSIVVQLSMEVLPV